MKINSRVSVALHSLLHILLNQRAMTSEELSMCLNTNPVVIRRVLGELRKNGLVDSQKGHGGGWVLKKKASQLSFQDVFDALDESLLPKSENFEGGSCLILSSLTGAMNEVKEEAEALLIKKLKKIKLSDLARKIEGHHS